MQILSGDTLKKLYPITPSIYHLCKWKSPSPKRTIVWPFDMVASVLLRGFVGVFIMRLVSSMAPMGVHNHDEVGKYRSGKCIRHFVSVWGRCVKGVYVCVCVRVGGGLGVEDIALHCSFSVSIRL